MHTVVYMSSTDASSHITAESKPAASLSNSCYFLQLFQCHVIMQNVLEVWAETGHRRTVFLDKENPTCKLLINHLSASSDVLGEQCQNLLSQIFP
uniref:Uncharacterized protein n=1 Tax=Arundo donax TaxID=35708 RepID=A0A0A9BHK6_ARUDO